MKKIIASAGVVVLGTAGLQAAYAPGLTTQETSKPWSVALSLRGFYDDNYNTAPSNPSPGTPGAQGSAGVEIGPSFSWHYPTDTTLASVNLDYFLRYYLNRPDNSVDQNVVLDGKVDHRLSERYRIVFAESFAYSQEPQVLDANSTITTPIRTDADGLRNRVALNFTAQMTELFSLAAGYQNIFYHYFQDATDVTSPSNPQGVGSRGALLDRMENLFNVDGEWHLQENLTGLVGAQLEVVNYTSSDLITVGEPGTVRDYSSYYFYVGANYAISSTFNSSVHVGAQYIDFTQLPGDGWNPYLDLVGVYTYLPGCSLQFGVRQSFNATDIAGTQGNITTGQETTTAYASVNHRITPQLTGSLTGQYQYSVYQGGPSNGQVDQFLLLGLNMSYRFNQFWVADAGYNFDDLSSDLPNRSYTRNRFYAGVRVNY